MKEVSSAPARRATAARSGTSETPASGDSMPLNEAPHWPVMWHEGVAQSWQASDRSHPDSAGWGWSRWLGAGWWTH